MCCYVKHDTFITFTTLRHRGPCLFNVPVSGMYVVCRVVGIVVCGVTNSASACSAITLPDYHASKCRSIILHAHREKVGIISHCGDAKVGIISHCAGEK